MQLFINKKIRFSGLWILCVSLVLIGCDGTNLESAAPPKPTLPPPTKAEQAVMDDPCGNPEQAIKLFEKYREQVEDGDAAYFGAVGLTYEWCLDDHENAKIWYKKGIDVGGYVEAFNLANIYMQEGDEAQAELWYQKSAELGAVPGAAEAGKIAEQRKDYQEAVKWYQRAVDIEKFGNSYDERYGRYFAYYRLGELNYYQFKDYEKALDFYQKAFRVSRKGYYRGSAFYGRLNARVQLKKIARDDSLLSFNSIVFHTTYLEMDDNSAVTKKDKLFELAENLHQNGFNIRAMGIYYATIAMELSTLDEINRELERTRLMLNLDEKQQAKDWQNKYFMPTYPSQGRGYPYTGSLE